MADKNVGDLNLDNVDGVVLLDKSGSMGEAYKNGQTRWQAGHESISAVAAELAEHDDDGITVVPFNDTFSIIDNVTPDKVDEIFTKHRPDNGTYLGPPLVAVFNKFLPAKKTASTTVTEKYTEYVDVQVKNPKAGQKTGYWPFQKTEPDFITQKQAVEKTRTKTVAGVGYERYSPKKQVFIAVYTDGAAGDESAVIAAIVDASKRIKGRRDLGILFIQVGSDPGATAFLNRLNSGLEGVADFDIVAVEKLEDLEDFSIEQLIRKAFTE